MYVHTYVHTCIHTYIHTYIHTQIHVCILHTYVHTYIHADYMHTTCLHMYIHTSIRTYMHTYGIYIHKSVSKNGSERIENYKTKMDACLYACVDASIHGYYC